VNEKARVKTPLTNATAARHAFVNAPAEMDLLEALPRADRPG
jgi:hypothetical protein